MRIGLVADGLPELPFDALPRTAAELGVETLEFGCGNWSSAPHLDLNAMLGSERARDTFLGRIEAHGLAISALNCSGNPLHPGSIGGSTSHCHQQNDRTGRHAWRAARGDDVGLRGGAG